MRTVRSKLEELRGVERRRLHPLVHHIHKKHGISKKTLFYVKEYGAHSNVAGTIIRESLAILLLASVVSSLGGLALERIKVLLVSVMPLVVLMPALNDMVGDYGTIISSRFSTMLHEGKVRGWHRNRGLRKLFGQVFVISLVTAAFCAAVSVAVSSVSDHPVGIGEASKVFLIAIADVAVLVSILFLVSVFAGLYFFRKQEDPNNFLIPITTSIADFGNMMLLSVLIILFF
jgi:cation transporter-like permease